MIDRSPLTDTELRLIGLLAAQDVLFLPVRKWMPNEPAAATLERRAAFRDSGLPYFNQPGQGTAERQQSFRDADALEASGRVTFHRIRGKRSGWTLTRDEETRLRRVCLLYGPDELRLAMAGVRAAEAAGHVHHCGFAPEDMLSGCRWGDRQEHLLMALEETLLPGLAAGFVESASDCFGHVGYRLTDAGRRYLDDEPEKQDKRPLPKAATDSASKYYTASFCGEWRARKGWKPSVPGHVAIPLSAGLWPAIKPLNTEAA